MTLLHVLRLNSYNPCDLFSFIFKDCFMTHYRPSRPWGRGSNPPGRAIRRDLCWATIWHRPIDRGKIREKYVKNTGKRFLWFCRNSSKSIAYWSERRDLNPRPLHPQRAHGKRPSHCFISKNLFFEHGKNGKNGKLSH